MKFISTTTSRIFRCAISSILGCVFLSQCTPIVDDQHRQLAAEQQNSRSSYLQGYGQANPADQLISQKGFWDGDGVQGKALIRISLDEQVAYFYRGQQLVGLTPIATGKAGYETPRGSYKISQKSKDHKSSLYGTIRRKADNSIVVHDADTRQHKAQAGEYFDNAPMPYFMRFNGAIGMHTGHLPGYAASHGCVRLPDHMAAKFFENVKIGTLVVVDY